MTEFTLKELLGLLKKHSFISVYQIFRELKKDFFMHFQPGPARFFKRKSNQPASVEKKKTP